MFTVYYFIDRCTSQVVFTNDEFNPCLTYIKVNGLNPQHCVIVSPNKRRITFNSNNDLVFGAVPA